MNYIIKNDYLEVTISSLGAEIKSIKYLGEERLHDSNPTYWNRSAPLLFPNIGITEAYFNQIYYPLPKHGIVRNSEVTLINKTISSITFSLDSSNETKKMYPFDFYIEISYELINNEIKGTFKVKNPDYLPLPFNFGLHPAFKLPINDNEEFSDYLIDFYNPNNYQIPTLDANSGFMDFTKITREFKNLKELKLNYSDYDDDALVFTNLNTNQVTLKHQSINKGVTVKFDGFTKLGIWTPARKNAPFICIEPWIGCSDDVNKNHEFYEKDDLIVLDKDEEKIIEYSYIFF